MPSINILAVVSVALSAMMVAIAGVLAYLFYIGLTYAKRGEGKHILRAIVAVWVAITIHEFVTLWFQIGIASRTIEVSYDHIYADIPVGATLMVASLYYLWATVRRNPPKNGGESERRVGDAFLEGPRKSS